jgi:hypothetical protein
MYNGDANAELGAGKQVLQAAVKVGDPKAICWGHYDMGEALSRNGRLDGAAVQLFNALSRLNEERWFATESIFGGTRGFFLLQCSTPHLARPVLAEAWKITLSKWNFIEYSLRCLPLLLESIVGIAWLHQSVPKDDQNETFRLARWIGWLMRISPQLHPSMLRSLGRLAACRGKTGKAVRRFRRAVASAERQKMPFYLAKSLLDLAAVDPTDRDANRKRAVELLKEMESVIPRAEAWLLGDQYDESVVAPEFDLEAWEAEHGVISRPARETPVEPQS